MTTSVGITISSAIDPASRPYHDIRDYVLADAWRDGELRVRSGDGKKCSRSKGRSYPDSMKVRPGSVMPQRADLAARRAEYFGLGRRIGSAPSLQGFAGRRGQLRAIVDDSYVHPAKVAASRGWIRTAPTEEEKHEGVEAYSRETAHYCTPRPQTSRIS